MKIVVVGTGFVGLTHAAVCSEYGHEVHAYDISEERVAAYKSGQTSGLTAMVTEDGTNYFEFELSSAKTGGDASMGENMKEAEIVPVE